MKALRTKLEVMGQLLFITLLFLLFSTAYKHSAEALHSLRNFVAHQGNYSRLRLSDSTVASAWEAKRILPENAVVEASPSEWNLTRIKARYALFPEVLIGNSWSYFIDFGNTQRETYSTWNSFRLSTGTVIYAKPGVEFRPQMGPPVLPPEKPLTTLFVFLAVTITYILVGLSILALVRVKPADGGLIWHIATGYLLGFLLLTLILWFLLLFNGILERKTVLAIWGGGAILLLFLAYKRIVSDYSHWRFEQAGFKDFLKITLPVAAFTCLLLIAIFARTVFAPVYFDDWDSMSHWIIKSKAFFHHKRLVFDYTYNNQYPILWPLNIAAQFALLGGSYDEVAKWTSAILFLAFIAQLKGALSFLRVNQKWLWISICLFLACFTTNSVTRAYAENGFLAFGTGALAGVLWWLRFPSQRQFLYLSVIMALGSATIKLEGVVGCIVLGTALALVYPGTFRSWSVWLLASLFIIPALALSVTWHLWLEYSGYIPDTPHFSSALSIEKLMVIGKALLRDSRREVYYAFFAGIALFAFSSRSKLWSKAEVFLLIISLALVLFIGVALIGWDTKTIARSSHTATERLFLHAAPALILLLASRAGERTADI